MKIKVTDTLNKHLQEGCKRAESSGSLDVAVSGALVSLLEEELSHANHILSNILRDWEIQQLKNGLERKVSAQESEANAMAVEKQTPCDTLQSEFEHFYNATASEGVAPIDKEEGEQLFNSAHFLMWLLRKKSFVASKKLEAYNITEGKVAEFLSAMPADEDYYADLAILERLSKLGKAQQKLDEKIHSEESDQEETESERADSPKGRQTRGGSKVKSETKGKSKFKSYKSAIEQFCVDLTESAHHGEIDPVIGREKETERVIQILSRRKKNNPILIGEAGVGKSAIVEGLALRIANEDVPSSLLNKEIYSLDIASLVAGTKYRGEFEERIKNFLEQLQSNRDAILFIDEIHTIAGAGSTSGSLDTANILKPALARGEIQCIGATTFEEYREHIESDSALERRFQQVVVTPTTKEQTLEILRKSKAHYEEHHGVSYTDDALVACVELTERYIPSRNFPDKAIDALDEAGAKARLAVSTEPIAIKELVVALTDVENQIELQGVNKDSLQIRAHLLSKKIEEMRADWSESLSQEPVVVDKAQIEEVVTQMSGVPVEQVSKGERERLVEMEAHLSEKVIGQEVAVKRVTQSIRRNRTGLSSPDRPMGVFLFVGPTGVGKTLLAKELAKWMFDDEGAIIRMDMSEYSEKHSTSRMIGSPPGYVGYSEGGQLTEAVRRHPYSVVLLDEIEKAHSDLYNLMLQVFDEGHLTDGNGRTVDFRNTVIIMTSNAGTKEVAERPKSIGFHQPTEEQASHSRDEEYIEALKRQFPLEFLNRIDDIVVFNTLDLNDIQNIVKAELEELMIRAKTLGYILQISKKACRQLALASYEPQFGARSIRRSILRNVEEPLAELIVKGEIEAGDQVKVEWEEDKITLEPVK